MLRGQSTPTRFPTSILFTPMENTPFRSLPNVCCPWVIIAMVLKVVELKGLIVAHWLLGGLIYINVEWKYSRCVGFVKLRRNTRERSTYTKKTPQLWPAGKSLERSKQKANSAWTFPHHVTPATIVLTNQLVIDSRPHQQHWASHGGRFAQSMGLI